MSHYLAMARQLRDYLSVLFLGLFAIFTALLYWRAGTFNLLITGALAALATGVVILRFWNPMRRDLARAKTRDTEDQARTEAIRNSEQEREFGLACFEIVKMMSRLSDADLSVFITADKRCKSNGDTYRFVTSGGSPVHEVLVAMVDVDCTKPVEIRRIVPTSSAALATYELTGWGRHILERFIRDSLRYRKAGPSLT